MTTSEEYLKILSKLMNEENNTNVFPEEYTKADHYIHMQLAKMLNSSSYPNSPYIMGKLNGLMESFRNIVLCNEIRDTGTLLFTMYNTNEGINLIQQFNCDKELKELIGNVKTTIPIVIYPAESRKIEALTYADKRIELSVEEYRNVIIESGRNKIALNKVVKLFIIGCSLADNSLSYVFDNIFFTAGNMLKAHIMKFIHCFLKEEKDKSFYSDKYYDYVYCAKSFWNNMTEYKKYKNINKLNENDLVNLIMEMSGKKRYYSFADNLRTISAQIKSFYHLEIKKADKIIQSLTADIVRDEGMTGKLTKLRTKENQHKETLKKEYKQLSDLLSTIECHFDQVDDNTRTQSEHQKMYHQIEDIVSEVFIYTDAEMYTDAEKALSRLKVVDNNLYIRLEQYINKLKNSKYGVEVTDISSENDDWINAKLCIALKNIDDMQIEELAGIIYRLVYSHYGLTTGKELYAKAMVSETFERSLWLKKSLEKGYAPAGEKLYHEHNVTDKELKYLAERGVAEACIKLGYKSGASAAKDLEDSRLAYYKIAAAKGKIDIISEIADILYKNNIKYIHEILDSDNQKIKCANQLYMIYNYLIDNRYEMMKNKARRGIILFMLKRYSEAYKMLSGVNTTEAHYCRGRMLQTGKGVIKNLELAKKEYERAGEFQDSVSRMNTCIEKIEEENVEDEDDYNEDEDYSKSYGESTSYSTGWCFITTAACKSLKSEDDCEELNAMRRFRDDYLLASAEGDELVYEYYRIGPVIVDHINRVDNPDVLYNALWNDYIKICYDKIKAKQYEEAKGIYIDMVRELCNRFSINVNQHIAQKYNIKQE